MGSKKSKASGNSIILNSPSSTIDERPTNNDTSLGFESSRGYFFINKFIRKWKKF